MTIVGALTGVVVLFLFWLMYGYSEGWFSTKNKIFTEPSSIHSRYRLVAFQFKGNTLYRIDKLVDYNKWEQEDVCISEELADIRVKELTNPSQDKIIKIY